MKKSYLSMSIIPFLIFTVNTSQAGTPAPLPNIKEAASYASIDIKGTHSPKEVFRHFSSECAGGKLLFLASLKGGRFVRLTLLNNIDASSYMETDGDNKYPWLLACEGAAKFLVEKEHQYGPGNPSFRLYKGRALEGIDYAVNRPAEHETASAMDDAAFAEKMASELAAYKMSFISSNNGTRFSGRYESAAGKCDTVSVARLAANGSTTRFKVCSGRVYTLSNPLPPMMAAAE
jgi:hypothetical protein